MDWIVDTVNHLDPVQTQIRVGGGIGSLEGMFEGKYTGDLGREVGCIITGYLHELSV